MYNFKFFGKSGILRMIQIYVLEKVEKVKIYGVAESAIVFCLSLSLAKGFFCVLIFFPLVNNFIDPIDLMAKLLGLRLDRVL